MVLCFNIKFLTFSELVKMKNRLSILCLSMMCAFLPNLSHAQPTDVEIYAYREIYEYLRNVATSDKLKNSHEAIRQGVEDALAGKPSRYSDDEFLLAVANIEKQRQREQLEKIKENRIEGEKFLTENAKKAGVITTKSGLQYKIIKQGTGKKPKANSTVTFHYEGRFINGEVFDSSYDRSPMQAQLGEDLIQGLNEGLQYIGAGGKIELYIPDHLAYADMATPLFDGGESLIFKVELLEVK